MESKFILFAHARSGSTSLARALAEHPDVNLAIEPFHPDFSKWNPGAPNYSELITNIGVMQKCADELFSQYNAIKVLDYQLEPEIYASLLLRKDIKVIYLRRANILQSIVSGLIAEQTNVWHADEKREAETFALEPISLEVISRKLNYARELYEIYHAIISRKPDVLRLEITHEEFYTNDVRQSLAHLFAVQDFLGISRFENEAVCQLLDPLKSKLNASYDAVPNAKAINKKFGCDKSGWLNS